MISYLKIIAAVLHDTFHEWLRNKPNLIGAALSFYIILSLGPMLIVGVWLSGIIFGKRVAETQIINQISAFIGEKPAAVLDAFITNAVFAPTGSISSYISIPLILFGAAMIFFSSRTLSTLSGKLSRKKEVK